LEQRFDPIRNGVVLIEGEKIAAVSPKQTLSIPKNADRIDCSGLGVTAGYWNSHVHFFEREWANAAEIPPPELSRRFEEMLTRFGFTSVFGTVRCGE
jgi:cytosine/adenosine deaminase-related metal-dependent hydrolase